MATVGKLGSRLRGVSLWLVSAAAMPLAGCGSDRDAGRSEAEGETGQLGQVTNPLGIPGRLGARRDTPGTMSARRLTSAPAASALAASVDLSPLLPSPGDQGDEGSCLGWASGYALKTYQDGLEGEWPIGNDRYQFSPSWIYNQINGGQDLGALPSRALDLLVNKGADTLEFFPYVVGQFTIQPNAASFSRAARFKAQDWGTLSVNETTFKQVLASQQPIMITFEVFADFDSINSSNEVYDDSSGSTRGRHAATIVGYDDVKSAFRLINSWGTGWGLNGYGYLGYAFLNDIGLMLDAYTLTDGSNAAPPVQNSLYIVQDGHVWRADNDFGDYALLSDADWSGATSAAYLGGSVYIVQNSHLHKLNPTTGAYTVLGGAAWPGETTMAAINGSLYITQDDGLWKITNLSTGAFTRVGNADWTGATSMTALGSSLYILQADYLHKVNPTSGSYTVLGTADWPGPTSMTAVGSNLYITQDDGLWKVDNLTTGAYQRLGNANWSGPTSVANLDGKLYVIQASRLHEVDVADGSFEVLGHVAWAGPTVMAAVP